MKTAGQPGVSLAAPLLGLILLGVLATALIYLEPTALYGTAAGILVVCFALLGTALVARREAPRTEAPDPDRLELWIRDALDAGTPEAARSVLLTLGRWPHQLPSVDPAAREQLRRLVQVTESVEFLKSRLDPDAPWSQRVEALHLISWLGLMDPERLLIDRLTDPDLEVASAAASALARSGTRSALDAVVMSLGSGVLPPSRLATLLEDANPGVLLEVVAEHAGSEDAERRFWIAHLAGRTGDDRALPILLELSHDPDADVRANAADSLGLLANAARARLHELLNEDSWVVRAHAARALGELGPGPSVAELTARLHDSSWWVRENAVLALERLDQAEAPRLALIRDDLRGTARTALDDVITNLRALPGDPARVAPPERSL